MISYSHRDVSQKRAHHMLVLQPTEDVILASGLANEWDPRQKNGKKSFWWQWHPRVTRSPKLYTQQNQQRVNTCENRPSLLGCPVGFVRIKV